MHPIGPVSLPYYSLNKMIAQATFQAKINNGLPASIQTVTIYWVDNIPIHLAVEDEQKEQIRKVLKC